MIHAATMSGPAQDWYVDRLFEVLVLTIGCFFRSSQLAVPDLSETRFEYFPPRFAIVREGSLVYVFAENMFVLQSAVYNEIMV